MGFMWTWDIVVYVTDDVVGIAYIVTVGMFEGVEFLMN